MKEPEVDRIVRSWLEEGVMALPDRVLDTVLHELPGTPQRRARWPARRSITMSSPIRLVAAAAAIGVLTVAGVVPWAGGPQRNQLVAGPSPGAAPSLPAADLAPAPVTGDLVWVEGTEGGDFEQDERFERGYQQRVRVRQARSDMSDARLSGTVTVTDNADRFFVDPDASLEDPGNFLGDILWGTVTIENEAGTWTGTLVGTSDTSNEGFGTSYIELVGGGAYDGLSAVLFERENHPTDWDWNGVIISGDLPPDR